MSTPLTWDQLADVDPDDFDVLTVPDLLAEHGDLHAPDWTTRRSAWRRRWSGTTGTSATTASATCPIRRTIPKMPGEPKRVQPSKARPEPEA